MRSQVNRRLVFDIGGTSIRAGIAIDQRGGQIESIATSVSPARSSIDPMAALSSTLQSLAARINAERPSGVVLAVPGPVVGGVVARLPTLLEQATPIDIAAIGAALWPGAKIWVCNDLTAAGHGFARLGHRDFCVVTCGSGIGAKLFVDGRALLGKHGMGGEIGHWRVPGAPPLPCDCGGFGHLGALASGRGALQFAQFLANEDRSGFAASAPGRERPEPAALTTHTLVENFRDGDDWTCSVIEKSANALGAALAMIHLASATGRFFITGGFATALGPRFGSMIAAAAARGCWPTGINWHDAVEVVEPNVEWGLVGACHFADVELPVRQADAPCD